MVRPEAGPGLHRVDPAGNVLEVLRQEVLRAWDDVEGLGAVPPVADLEVLVADADEPAVVAPEHVGVQVLEDVDQQLAVVVIFREFRRIQPFSHVN